MDNATGGRKRELTVQLLLELGREPVRGLLRVEDGTEERFVGWLGFVDALKRLRETADPARDPNEKSDDDGGHARHPSVPGAGRDG